MHRRSGCAPQGGSTDSTEDASGLSEEVRDFLELIAEMVVREADDAVAPDQDSTRVPETE